APAGHRGPTGASANRAMTLFTSLGPSADCRGLTQVPTYQVRIGRARGAAFSVSQRSFSLGWAFQGNVARTPHQSKGSADTVWPVRIGKSETDCSLTPPRRQSGASLFFS